MIGPLAYIGGKRRVAKRLAAMLPPHQTYVEVFAGGAQVFFAKEPSPVEVLNDLDGDVVNFMRCCQLHHEELIRYLRFMVASRRIYELYTKQDPETLTDVQRASRFLYLQKNSFGGKVTGRNYHICVQRAPNYNLTRIPQLLEAAARRLERVQLEQWPYERILERFDRPDAAFFLDPPYSGVRWYNFNFTDDDFRELAGRLATIRGKFLLTVNDLPLTREVFGRFRVEHLEFVYTASRTVPRVRELLVSNYAFPVVKPSEQPRRRTDV
jgi:DNA adenine methylase